MPMDDWRQVVKRKVTVDAPEQATACFCDGAVTSWFKVLSSFNIWFRGAGRDFNKSPLHKHKRCL